MTKLLLSGVLAVAMLGGIDVQAKAQDAGQVSLELVEVPPPVQDDPLNETERRLRRYKRMRIVGGTLMAASVAAVVVPTAVAAAQYDCDPSGEWFCGLSSPGFVAAMMTAWVSPAVVAGGITLGMGIKRHRRLQLETPTLSASPHGFALSLRGSF